MSERGGSMTKFGWAALFCFLLAAGIRGTGAVPPPSPFEKEIKAFETRDRTNPPPKGAVLFLGSSSIRLWPNLPAAFPELTVIQRGFGGSHIPDSTRFADRIVIPYQPSRIVLYAGDNDIAGGASPEQVLASFKQFVRKVHGALPKTEIDYISIKPSPSRWHLSPQMIEANALIKKHCASQKFLKFIDVWNPLLDSAGQSQPALFRSDRLHLNERGYAVWTRVIREALGLKPRPQP